MICPKLGILFNTVLHLPQLVRTDCDPRLAAHDFHQHPDPPPGSYGFDRSDKFRERSRGEAYLIRRPHRPWWPQLPYLPAPEVGAAAGFHRDTHAGSWLKNSRTCLGRSFLRKTALGAS